jgi:hypothetical protein
VVATDGSFVAGAGTGRASEVSARTSQRCQDAITCSTRRNHDGKITLSTLRPSASM